MSQIQTADIGNSKYVSTKVVEGMIARNHKSLVFSSGDIEQWCWECIEEIGNYDAFMPFTSIIKVENGKGELPCNIYRILYLNGCNASRLEGYVNDGVFIHTPFRSGQITIDYLGIPGDENGLPLIENTSRQACYYFCLKKLKYDDFLNQKMTIAAWQDITSNYDEYWRFAKGSFRNKSMDDLNRFHEVVLRFHRTPIMDRQSFFNGGGS